LKALTRQIFYEHFNEPNYEGRYGASPREIRVMILNAAQDPRFDHLCVGAIFEQIEQLIEQRSSYDFLRREPVRGFRDPSYLLDSVKRHYVSILEDEVRNALGLFSKESYLESFTRYIMHVSAWTKKERLIDPLFQRRIDADEAFMANIESKLLAFNEDKEDFRRQLIAQIGAFKLENPAGELDYRIIFSGHLRRLKESVYKEQQEAVGKIITTFLRLSENDGSGLKERDVTHARALKLGLSKLGYNDQSSRWAMAFLVKSKDLLPEKTRNLL
jgi:predicted Ser/Thr protein kinase